MRYELDPKRVSVSYALHYNILGVVFLISVLTETVW